MTGRPLRIALLAHSTNPRGGVIHALELGDALTRLGHDVVVHAPDAAGRGFFRPTLCRTACVPASPLPAGATGTLALVESRVADYERFFAAPAARAFDIFHAQDGISGNALATLKERGLIEGFVRTVHHLDVFEDPRLMALQRRSVVAADAHLVVSRLWQEILSADEGLDAILCGNGVDTHRFAPQPAPQDLLLRRRLGLQAGPVILAVGGIEERKNTLRLLAAFAQLFAMRPEAQLVIAGGSSLLDHDDYQARFAATLAASGLPAHALCRIGPVDDADMPSLYRNADVLAFPSVTEGFGLVVLEAMASGVPVVASRIRPFTDHLGEDDVVWCAPGSPSAIADALLLALYPRIRDALRSRGPDSAARFGWDAVARTHLALYEAQGALHHA